MQKYFNYGQNAPSIWKPLCRKCIAWSTPGLKYSKAAQLLHLYAKIHNHTYENRQAELSTKQLSSCKIFTSYTSAA